MPTRSLDALPTFERVLFPAKQLELALVQVKFPPLPRYEEQGFLNDFKEALVSDYPLFAAERALALQVSPQGVIPGQGPVVHRFSTLDYTWSIVLAADAISLESRAYSEINDFAARFCSILERVRDTLKVRHQLRFGLRYVNEFRHTRGETYDGWAVLGLNSELLGIGTRNVFGGTVAQTVSEFRANRADGSLVLRHGFLDGTTIVPIAGRKPTTGRFYLLDLDYFNEQAGDFNAHPVDRMILYNEFLYRVFRWCIGNGELCRHLQGS
jgi:uncharacterized protein (TIGR04255 family)